MRKNKRGYHGPVGSFTKFGFFVVLTLFFNEKLMVHVDSIKEHPLWSQSLLSIMLRAWLMSFGAAVLVLGYLGPLARGGSLPLPMEYTASTLCSICRRLEAASSFVPSLLNWWKPLMEEGTGKGWEMQRTPWCWLSTSWQFPHAHPLEGREPKGTGCLTGEGHSHAQHTVTAPRAYTAAPHWKSRRMDSVASLDFLRYYFCWWAV